MQEPEFAALESLFLALSDKTRLRLLALMANGEVSVGFLANKLGESQPKISRHLAYLRGAGLVSTRRDGKWIYYGIETQIDFRAGRVLEAALHEMGVSDVLQRTQNQSWGDQGDAYRPTIGSNLYEHTDMNDWYPNEIEIHLL